MQELKIARLTILLKMESYVRSFLKNLRVFTSHVFYRTPLGDSFGYSLPFHYRILWWCTLFILIELIIPLFFTIHFKSALSCFIKLLIDKLLLFTNNVKQNSYWLFHLYTKYRAFKKDFLVLESKSKEAIRFPISNTKFKSLYEKMIC